MRIFSILAAIAVTAILAMSILARPQLMAMLGAADAADAPVEAGQAGAEPEAPAAAPQQETRRVKVSVRRFEAQQVDSAVVLRGQTEAARAVDVRAETSAVVSSAPLRKGTEVSQGDPMCVLDAGTRGAALQEAKARLSEAESRVPEAEARVEEAQAKLEEARNEIVEELRGIGYPLADTRVSIIYLQP